MLLERQHVQPREGWQAIVEEDGLSYHSGDPDVQPPRPYWDELHCYRLDVELVDEIEYATELLHRLCIDVVNDLYCKQRFDGYNLSPLATEIINASFGRGDEALYGRFDFGLTTDGKLKMFEYNADTPTALLEAAVIQWRWKQQVFPAADQFNSIEEKLIDCWKLFGPIGDLYFTALSQSPAEDWATVHYLMETAHRAGRTRRISSIDLESIGWNSVNLTDLNDQPISTLFKLYPYEWMFQDEFAQHLVKPGCARLIEPPWKYLISNKQILVELWERWPDCPYLLPAYDDSNCNKFDPRQWHVIKPKLSREGQGVITDLSNISPEVLTKDRVFQQQAEIQTFSGFTPVIGSWVIGGKAAGIGIREDVGVTTNNSRFVPHYFQE